MWGEWLVCGHLFLMTACTRQFRIVSSEVLDGHCQTDKETNKSFMMMRGAVEFMAGTLNDLLSVQMIEEGKLELDMRPFDLIHQNNVRYQLPGRLNSRHGQLDL